MVEKLRPSEAFQHSLPPIIPKEQFDHLLIKDPTLLSKIVGVTSVSWQHLANCNSSTGFALQPWRSSEANINLAVVGQVLHYRGGVFVNTSLEEIIERNRLYGVDWAAGELLMEMGVVRSIRQADNLVDEMNITWLKEMEAGLTRGEALEEYQLKDYQVQRPKLVSYFANQTDADLFWQRLENERGVQVIFQNPARFIQFLEANEWRKVDDHAIRLYTPIPRELIYAFVPLGAQDDVMLTQAFKL